MTKTAIAPILFGTAGHVDHGKSTLVRKLTGIDPDRFEEEQRRGMTLDLGYSRMQIDESDGTLEVGFVDVPGHEGFVKNMVVGAIGVDAVLLIVAADEGVMPQTREHMAVCDLLGARGGVCALTKADLVDDEMLELATMELRDQLAGTFLADASIIPVSAVADIGIDTLKDHLLSLARSLPPRPVDGPYRLPIHRVFSRQGQGTVVTGVPLTGSAHIGDTLEVVERHGKKGTIRSIQAYWHEVDTSRPGHTAGLNLRGLDADDVERGCTLATPGIYHADKLADATVRWLGVSPMLENGMQCFAHVGSARVGVTIHVLGADALAPGETGYVQLEFDEATIIVPGDRYLLRLPSPPGTVGGGLILGPSPKQHRRRRLKTYTVEEVTRRHDALAEPETHLADLCAAAGNDGLTGAEAARGLAQLPAQVSAIAESTIARNLIVFEPRSRRYFATSVLDAARAQLRDTLATFHKTSAHRLGINHATLTSALKIVPEAARALLTHAVGSGDIVDVTPPEGGDPVYALPTHKPTLSDKLATAAPKLEAILADKPYDTPEADDFAKAVGLSGDDFTKLLDYYRDSQRVTVLDGGIYTVDAVKSAGDLLVEAIEKNGPTGLATFRDMLNTSRKHAQRIIDQLTLIGRVEHGEGNLRQLPTRRK